jgi:hypothetical protein
MSKRVIGIGGSSPRHGHLGPAQRALYAAGNHHAVYRLAELSPSRSASIGSVLLSQNFSGLSVDQVQPRAGLTHDGFVLVVGRVLVVFVPPMLNV